VYYFLVEPQKKGRAGMTVAAESWVEIGVRLHQVCGVYRGFSVERQNQGRRLNVGGAATQAGLTTQVGVIWPPGSVWLPRWGVLTGLQRQEPSKRRTCGMIARIALMLRRLACASIRWWYNEDFWNCPLGRVSTILLVGVFYSFGCPYINLWDAG
jgi:hypothetical protein